MLRAIDKDIPTPNVAEIMKLVLMIGDIRLLEEQKGVAGDVYIFDASVATPGHFAKFTPAIVKKFLICVQEAYPVKLKEVHIVNVSPLVDTIINFVKPFLKEKIRQRIHFHSNVESLYKVVPKSMLPKEYGGDAGEIAVINSKFRDSIFLFSHIYMFFFRALPQINGKRNWKNMDHGLRNRKNQRLTRHCDRAHQRRPMICSAWTEPSENLPLIEEIQIRHH